MFVYCLNNPVNHADKTGMTSDSYAGWIGEQLGELLYELFTGDDHPSHQTRELENQIRQEQNKAIGNVFKSIWVACMRGYTQQQETQIQEAEMIVYRFSTPERTTETLVVIGAELSLIGVFWGGKLVQGAGALIQFIAALLASA